MDQCGGLQRLPRRLAGHLSTGQVPQLIIDQRHQIDSRLPIAFAGRLEYTRDGGCLLMCHFKKLRKQRRDFNPNVALTFGGPIDLSKPPDGSVNDHCTADRGKKLAENPDFWTWGCAGHRKKEEIQWDAGTTNREESQNEQSGRFPHAFFKNDN